MKDYETLEKQILELSQKLYEKFDANRQGGSYPISDRVRAIAEVTYDVLQYSKGLPVEQLQRLEVLLNLQEGLFSHGLELAWSDEDAPKDSTSS